MSSDLAATQAQLVGRLYVLAQRFAQWAADELADNHPDEAMAHSGISLEYLAKAFLAHQHPLLIVAAPSGRLDPAGMRWALGRTAKPSPRSRTITADEAIRRCCELIDDVAAVSLQPVIQARNGVLHIGQSDADASQVIAALAVAADAICPLIGRDSRGFWGHFHGAVRGRLDKRRSLTVQRIDDRIAQARDRREQMFKRFGVEAMNALVGEEPHGYNEQATTCPACGSEAIVRGRVDVEEGPDPDPDPDSNPWVLSHAPLTAYFSPDTLRCRACAFWLEGPEEFVAAGMVGGRHELDLDEGELEYLYAGGR